MAKPERYSKSFDGKQIGEPLIFTSGVVTEPTPQKHDWHSHVGYEFFFVEDGSLPFEFDNKGEVIHIPAGHFAVLKPKQKHRGQYGIFFPCSYYWVELNPFNKDALSNLVYNVREFEEIFKTFDNKKIMLGRSSTLLVQLLKEYKRALHELSEKSDFGNGHPHKPSDGLKKRQKWIRTLLVTIMLEAVHCLEHPSNFKNNKHVEAARKFIIENYMNEINIHDVIAPLEVSEAYLYNVFKEYTGVTPNNYLLDLRLQKACDILSNTDVSITRIALECGFSCSQYFSNVFKNYTGEPPSTFRKRIKKAHKK